uniref:Uncharacterized protein n=1 Tax=Cannabis sativa TaxID=3483 RepID=A0A803Q4J0_CANSA
MHSNIITSVSTNNITLLNTRGRGRGRGRIRKKLVYVYSREVVIDRLIMMMVRVVVIETSMRGGGRGGDGSEFGGEKGVEDVKEVMT